MKNKKKETPKNIVEWFIKHKISCNVCPLDEAIARALDSEINI